MNDNKKATSRVTAVGCCVENCSYHTDTGHCCAKAISVENATAKQKSETFCSTFTPKN
ncbi:MAG TPA: DUF1540 domain-containing protein [Firmicutes bacterium]|nr:DUF1540 domain-containing protein [Bacillota bacterium]